MKTYILSAICLSTALFAPDSSALIAADAVPNWTSFQNAGTPVTPEKLPIEWTPDTVAWKTPIVGYGQSTALVHQGLVYVTSTSGDNKDNYHLTTLALDTGTPVWTLDFNNPSPEKNSSYVSRAAPSPVIDTAACYAFFEGGLVAAVTHAGKKVWNRDLVADYGKIEARHGLASSLAHDENNLYVWVERSEDPYLVAMDKRTGKTVWKVAGLGASTWSSPRLLNIDGARQLVCSGSGLIAGFDPIQGTRLWEFDAVANNTSCSPMPAATGQFLVGASDGRGEENVGKGSAYNGLVEVSKTSDGNWSVEYKWHAKRATSSFGSPIVAGDSAYFVNRLGVLYKNDLKTGAESAPQRLSCGGIWATPLVANNKLYLFGQTGTTSVVDLQTGEEIATNQLWESTPVKTEPPQGGEPGSLNSGVLYAGTPAGDYLILRRGDIIYAVK